MKELIALGKVFAALCWIMVLALAPRSSLATPVVTSSEILLKLTTNSASGNREFKFSGEGLLDWSDDLVDVPFPGVVWVGHVRGETAGGTFAAHATARATDQAVLGENGIVHRAGGQADARAMVDFEVRLVQKLLPMWPPEVPLFVPVDVTMLLSVFTTAVETPQAFGLATALVLHEHHTDPVALAQAFSNDEDTIIQTLRWWAQPDAVTSFQLGAFAHASAKAGTVRDAGLRASATAKATADPLFSFNQQAFDEIARAEGVPTFTLADHFRFEFSPGGFAAPPPTAVPAPWSLVLISLGAGGLAILATFHSRPPRRRRSAESARRGVRSA